MSQNVAFSKYDTMNRISKYVYFLKAVFTYTYLLWNFPICSFEYSSILYVHLPKCLVYPCMIIRTTTTLYVKFFFWNSHSCMFFRTVLSLRTWEYQTGEMIIMGMKTSGNILDWYFRTALRFLFQNQCSNLNVFQSNTSHAFSFDFNDFVKALKWKKYCN